MTAHAETAAQLREVADLLESLPEDVPTPIVSDAEITFQVWSPLYPEDRPWGDPVQTVPERAGRIAALFGAPWDAVDPNRSSFDAVYATFVWGYRIGGREVLIRGTRENLATVNLPAEEHVETQAEVLA